MDNKIKKRRLKTLRNYLKFLEQNPDDWNNLHLSCRNNVSEYSSFLKDYCSIFNNIPTKLVKAKDLLSNAKKWESYKVEWYKELSSNYPDSWIPISDFQSGEDEMFVDIADEGLPILITKFMGRNDFRKEVACESLAGFVEIRKVYNKANKGRSTKDTILKILALIVAIPLLPLLLPLYFYKLYRTKKEKKIWEKENGYIDGKKVYLVWQDISGAGTLTCNDCGEKMDVIGFTHGNYSCKMGVQCQKCGHIFTEYNKSEKYHQFSPRTEDVLCPQCGNLCIGKEEYILSNRSKGFLFCTKCRSKNLKYDMSYIT